MLLIVTSKKHIHVCLSTLVWINDRVVLIPTGCSLVAPRANFWGLGEQQSKIEEGLAWPLGLFLIHMLYQKVLFCAFLVTEAGKVHLPCLKFVGLLLRCC